MKSVRVVWSLLLAALVLTTGTPSTYAWSSAQATVSVFGGASSEYGYSIAVDSSGNVYTTGYFQGTVDFDPGTGTSNLTSAGSTDVFVSKLDSSGNFVWAKRLGGASSDYGYSIAVDSSGNVYTTGYFEGTADFDPGAGTSNLTSAGSGDVFVSKLDSSGALVWAKGFGGTSNDRGQSIAVDSSGNVYTTGYFAGTVDFDPGAGTSNLTSAGGDDVFVLKLTSSGEALTVALVYVPPILLYVPPMLPIIAPSIAVNSGVISCTIGEYSRAATSVVFSLFVDGNHLATNFSATGDYLPSWLAPWASASTVQRTASLTSASWDIGVVGNGSRASCWTLAYSQHATGLISSNSISLR